MNVRDRHHPKPNPSRSPGYSAGEDGDWLAGGQGRDRADMMASYWTYVGVSLFAVIMLSLCVLGAMP